MDVWWAPPSRRRGWEGVLWSTLRRLQCRRRRRRRRRRLRRSQKPTSSSPVSRLLRPRPSPRGRRSHESFFSSPSEELCSRESARQYQEERKVAAPPLVVSDVDSSFSVLFALSTSSPSFAGKTSFSASSPPPSKPCSKKKKTLSAPSFCKNKTTHTHASLQELIKNTVRKDTKWREGRRCRCERARERANRKSKKQKQRHATR